MANLDGSEVASFLIGRHVQGPTVEWSPDGTRLAFPKQEPLPAGMQSIMVSQIDGSGQVRLTQDVESRAPNWRP